MILGDSMLSGDSLVYAQHAQHQETVLVVDDDMWLRQVAVRTLRRGGFAVLEACDGHTALAMADQHHGVIDLVCTDAIMPGMGGAELVDRLRRARPELRAVFMSGYHADELVTWGIDATCTPYIQKPFTAAALTQFVRDELDAALASGGAATAPDPVDALIAHPARLRTLRDTGLLDERRDERFDRLTRLAAQFLRAPTALLSLLDEDRDFYLSSDGLCEPFASSRTMRGRTLCQFTLQSPAPLAIGDVVADPVYGCVPTVAMLGVGAYLGMPLIVDGETIGALCVVDVVPRDWSPDDIRVLHDLAELALGEIALRAATRLRDTADETVRRANLQLHLAKSTAEAASRAKSEFLAHMSHELRTPLTAIIGFGNVLRRNSAGGMSARELTYAERISANGAHLLSLVDRILDLSKVEEGDLTLRLTWLQVAAAVWAICDDFTEAGVAAGVSVTMAIEGLEGPDATPALLHTDITKFHQIAINLIANAIKFTPRGGSVRVVLGCEPRSGMPLRLDVTDTGIGIAPEAQARVFEAFEQADGDTNARFGGSGLGLSISRALCEALGYRLTLTSEVGVGSTFTVSFARSVA